MCEKTRLPFKKEFNFFRLKNTVDSKGQTMRQADVLCFLIKQSKLKAFVVDDSQFLMANEFFDRVDEVGFQKWMEIGGRFRNLIHMVNDELDDDVIVYFLHHTEYDSTTNKIKAKTIGKVLDEKLTLEGCSNIILRARTDGVAHWFTTQSDGTDTTKSPEGMFDFKIPNDLKLVDTTIREYYGITKGETK